MIMYVSLSQPMKLLISVFEIIPHMEMSRDFPPFYFSNRTLREFMETNSSSGGEIWCLT